MGTAFMVPDRELPRGGNRAYFGEPTREPVIEIVIRIPFHYHDRIGVL